jgi:hypothetical protein
MRSQKERSLGERLVYRVAFVAGRAHAYYQTRLWCPECQRRALFPKRHFLAHALEVIPGRNCPECGDGRLAITWTGGSPPYGPDHWECLCGNRWTTEGMGRS